MPIDHTCSCGKQFRLKDEYAGKKFRCPACNAVNQAALAPPSNWLSAELLSQLAPEPPNPVKAAPTLPAPAQRVTSRRFSERNGLSIFKARFSWGSAPP